MKKKQMYLHSNPNEIAKLINCQQGHLRLLTMRETRVKTVVRTQLIDIISLDTTLDQIDYLLKKANNLN
jgi:hypothetical protein